MYNLLKVLLESTSKVINEEFVFDALVSFVVLNPSTTQDSNNITSKVETSASKRHVSSSTE
jgi:hypothetical protein